MNAPVAVRGGVALVTGAGGGIGRATTLALAKRGATVLCLDINAAAAAATADACSAWGTPARSFGVDVADREAVRKLADEITADHGPVDILVNNAGVGLTGPFLDTRLEDWDWILGVNLLGVVNCAHLFGAAMVARGRGQVVNIASGLAYTHRATETAYITTKAGVLALSRALRADWRPHGVGVSAICPGVINTPIIYNTRFRGRQDDPKRVAKAQRLFSHGHPPERVADAILSAVARNRAVVPVGFEAWAGWLMHRLLPVEASDRIAAASDKLTG